jgi:transcriptional regulator with XRE-family HTH domain
MKTEDEIALCQMFGKHLAAIRKEKNWSQEKLALESGLARSYIGDVERGIRNIALINICKIADTLGIRVVDLMDFRRTGKTKKSVP